MSLAVNIRAREECDDHQFVASSTEYATIEVKAKPGEPVCFVEFKNGSPYSFTPQMLAELLECARETPSEFDRLTRARVLASNRCGVFSLGGDLSFFRDCIANGDEDALAKYALTATNLIWESVSSSGIEDLVSVCLVQGEAQGGGFEAALAGHILIAERDAYFGFPEGLFGLFPGMGARVLLTARGCGAHASKIIGSARRYSAEELYSLGIIDYLAEPGRGREMLHRVINLSSKDQFAEFRGRFVEIDRRSLVETVLEWVELAMKLPHKHLRTMTYLIQAQERARRKLPSIRAI